MSKDGTDKNTIAGHLKSCGYSRRDFVQLCSMLMVTAPAGLALTKGSVGDVVKQVGKARRPSVIWLHFQDCTGCSETLLRTSKPDVADLILNVISLDYHETLMAASGYQAEAALHQAMEENAGKYVLVCEGSVPLNNDGEFLYLAGKTGLKYLKDVAAKAAAVISMGSCASWGGMPSTYPNPTGAVGVIEVIKDKPVINIPGCPPNPYILLATVLEFAALGKLPALDEQNRPKFAYDRVIHDHCPRRAHFDAGRFVQTFGDEAHRQGYCLYKMGCKGPATKASCSTRHYNDLPDVWPIGVGAPCFGCAEKGIGFSTPLFDTVDIHKATPPNTYPQVFSGGGVVGAGAAGLVGLAAGAVGGAAWAASQHFKSHHDVAMENLKENGEDKAKAKSVTGGGE